MEEDLNTFQEVQKEESQVTFTHFKSDEEMLSFYLTLSRLVYVNGVAAKTSDLSKLQALYGKLRSFLSFAQMINSHHWEEGIADIQKACGTYLLESKQDRKLLLRSNERIAAHLEFITKLSSKNYQTKQIESILNCHLKYLVHLIHRQQK